MEGVENSLVYESDSPSPLSMNLQIKLTGRAVLLNFCWLQEGSSNGAFALVEWRRFEELLCLAMTSGLIAALRVLNRGEGSANSSSDVDVLAAEFQTANTE